MGVPILVCDCGLRVSAGGNSGAGRTLPEMRGPAPCSGLDGP